MQTIFYVPILANMLAEGTGIRREPADAIAHLSLFFAGGFMGSFCGDFNKGTAAFPFFSSADPLGVL